MINSWAYVGWLDLHTTEGHVASYWIDARDAAGVHPWDEDLSSTKCSSSDGAITFEFVRPLRPLDCSSKCNVIDPLQPLKVIWAYGPSWLAGTEETGRTSEIQTDNPRHFKHKECS